MVFPFPKPFPGPPAVSGTLSPTAPVNLIWGSGNTLIWAAGNNLTWGAI